MIIFTKKKILIISGGYSKEREISLQTGNQVARELKKNGYKNSYESSPYNPCIIIGLKNNKFYLSGIAPLLRNIHYTSEKEYYLPVLNRHRDFNNSTNYKSLFIEMSSKPF